MNSGGSSSSLDCALHDSLKRGKKIKIAKIIDFKSIDIAACFGFVSFFRGDLSSTETPVYLHYIVHVPLYLLYYISLITVCFLIIIIIMFLITS